jgi:hypothetical protein
MNTKQKICLWLGIAVIVLMGLFPPWMAATPNGRNYVAGGYGFILFPPNQFGESLWLARIDFAKLVAQWAMAAVVATGLIVTFAGKKPKDE